MSPPERRDSGGPDQDTAAAPTETPANAKPQGHSKDRPRRNRRAGSGGRYPHSFAGWARLLRERPYAGGWTW